MKFSRIAVVVLSAVSFTAAAHHGWSEYDQKTTLKLTGTIEEAGYEHPHGHIKLKTPGKTRNAVLAPPSRMDARGLSKEMLKVGGTATVDPVTGARTTSGGTVAVGGGAQRAVFQGTGGLLLITVSGDNSVTLTRAGGGGSMTATLTRAMTTSGGGITLLGSSTTLLPSGVQTYYVGGTLTVPANQPAGDYSGTFTLTVNYF